jgi:integrase
MITEWLKRVATTPARVRTREGHPQRYRATREGDDPEEVARRRKDTANRTWTILKATLNRAWRAGKIASDPWRKVESFKGVAAARVRWLTAAECTRLINAADAESGFRTLVQAGLLTGCRLGELAALDVGDFNPDSGTLHIRRSKSGKARHVVLNAEGAAFFRSLAAGRPGQAPLVPRWDGGRWLKNDHAERMRTACKHAGITPPIAFHGLRHCWASLAVMAGVPLQLVAQNLGHSDTRMVERHYGHLADDYKVRLIREFAPRFGIEAGNVVPIERSRLPETSV